MYHLDLEAHRQVTYRSVEAHRQVTTNPDAHCPMLIEQIKGTSIRMTGNNMRQALCHFGLYGIPISVLYALYSGFGGQML
jgi:hypothetical protein